VRRTAPRSLAAALGSLSGELAPRTVLAEVQRVWSEAVGGAIAREASPDAERDGVLTVSCSSSAWAQELDLMAPTLLSKVNDALGDGGIRRLRCVATPGRHRCCEVRLLQHF